MYYSYNRVMPIMPRLDREKRVLSTKSDLNILYRAITTYVKEALAFNFLVQFNHAKNNNKKKNTVIFFILNEVLRSLFYTFGFIAVYFISKRGQTQYYFVQKRRSLFFRQCCTQLINYEFANLTIFDWIIFFFLMTLKTRT